MDHKKLFLTLLLLAGMVEGSCLYEKPCHLWFNISLGNLPGGFMGTVNMLADFTEYSSLTNGDGVTPLLTPNMSNVYVKIVNGSAGYDVSSLRPNIGTYKLYFIRQNCSTGCSDPRPYAEICVNGTDYNNNFLLAPAIIYYTSVTPITKETSQYYRKWDFKWESNNSLINWSGTNANLTIWCDSYSKAVVPLDTYEGAQVGVYTKQQSKYFLTEAANSPRIREDATQYLVDDYYWTVETQTPYTFNLIDYTGGQCYRSTLAIQRTINDTLKNIWVERFQQDNLINPILENQTQYNILITCDDFSRNLGGLYIVDSDLTKDVLVSKPEIGMFTFKWDNVNISITTDYAASQLGCTIASQTTTNSYFQVYNVSSTGYTLDTNSANTAITNLTYTKTVGDRDGTYRVKCMVNDTTRGLLYIDKIVNLRNTTGYYKGFDMDLPATIIGLSRSFLYKMMALTVIVVILFLFNAQNYGTGAVVGVGGLMLFDFVGWFDVPAILLGSLGTLALFIKFSENRKEGG